LVFKVFLKVVTGFGLGKLSFYGGRARKIEQDNLGGGDQVNEGNLGKQTEL